MYVCFYIYKERTPKLHGEVSSGYAACCCKNASVGGETKLVGMENPESAEKRKQTRFLRKFSARKQAGRQACCQPREDREVGRWRGRWQVSLGHH